MGVKVHIAPDQRGAAPRDASGVYHEDHGGPEKLGDLRSAAQITVIPLVKAAHTLDYRDVGAFYRMT